MRVPGGWRQKPDGDLSLMISYPGWRLTFRDVRILTKEIPLLGAEWLYHEIYEAGDCCELHVLFWGAEGDEVFDFILSFDSLEVEEPGKLTDEALCGEHVTRGLAGLWGDPRVVRYTNRKESCTYEESEERVKLFLENQKTAAAPTIFAICLDEMVIGLAGCPVIDGKKEEFGFFYQMQEYSWGRGIGTRCQCEDPDQSGIFEDWRAGRGDGADHRNEKGRRISIDR